MHDDTADIILDLREVRLDRAIARAEQQDHDGAMHHLRAALWHMREAGADPLEVHHLASIIERAQRKVS